MKYDDASWHSGGDFPADLPPEAAATHTGMFLAWALLRGMAGEEHLKDWAGDLQESRLRKMTPGAYFMRLDGKLWDADFNAEGNAFASDYFELEKGKYLEDYEATFLQGLPSLYHVADTWENFDRLQPVLDKRYEAWKSRQG